MCDIIVGIAESLFDRNICRLEWFMLRVEWIIHVAATQALLNISQGEKDGKAKKRQSQPP